MDLEGLVFLIEIDDCQNYLNIILGKGRFGKRAPSIDFGGHSCDNSNSNDSGLECENSNSAFGLCDNSNSESQFWSSTEDLRSVGMSGRITSNQIAIPKFSTQNQEVSQPQ